jgi:hypothetical protein
MIVFVKNESKEYLPPLIINELDKTKNNPDSFIIAVNFIFG